jgi:ElaB/YqjD/DUF883 family membrane-anchored ribosome-binding protein
MKLKRTIKQWAAIWAPSFTDDSSAQIACIENAQHDIELLADTLHEMLDEFSNQPRDDWTDQANKNAAALCKRVEELLK